MRWCQRSNNAKLEIARVLFDSAEVVAVCALQAGLAFLFRLFAGHRTARHCGFKNKASKYTATPSGMIFVAGSIGMDPAHTLLIIIQYKTKTFVSQCEFSSKHVGVTIKGVIITPLCFHPITLLSLNADCAADHCVSFHTVIEISQHDSLKANPTQRFLNVNLRPKNKRYRGG